MTKSLIKRRCSKDCNLREDRRSAYEVNCKSLSLLVKHRWTLSSEFISPIWEGDQITELYSQGNFRWEPFCARTFVRNLWWNFLLGTFEFRGTFLFLLSVFNSESLGRSFIGLPRRPTLRVRTNLSADLVDFHFSNLWGYYLAPICWFQ